MVRAGIESDARTARSGDIAICLTRRGPFDQGGFDDMHFRIGLCLNRVEGELDGATPSREFPRSL
jgi:hypothetical protein